MAETKNDQPKMGSDQNKGSGSDTVSAAKISAGTSVGNVGETPMPKTPAGGAGTSAQSSTLASHTAKPMGGTSSTGAGPQASSSASTSTAPGTTGSSALGSGPSSAGSSASGASAQGASSKGSSSQQGGTTESLKQAASGAQERMGEAYEDAADWARDTYESASSWASSNLGGSTSRGGRSTRRMSGARQGVQTYVAQNPVMVGLVGLAAGLLLGALLPRTRKEDETFGQWADEVREQGLRYAHEMAQRGRDYVEQSFTGDDDRFSRHESEFGGASSGPTGQGPGATSTRQGANRH